MDSSNQFWQFSDNLRLQTNNLANLSLNDSIWSTNYTSKRPVEERQNFDIRVGGELNSVDLINSGFNSVNSSLKSDVNDFNVGFSNNGWKNVNNYSGFGSISLVKVRRKMGIATAEVKLERNIRTIRIIVVIITTAAVMVRIKVVQTRGSRLCPHPSLYREMRLLVAIFLSATMIQCKRISIATSLACLLATEIPVRAITPGLPLFLYNYSTHQLHGVFEAASFGGTNIDPTAWEDKKNPGESRFPAQVRVLTRKVCEPLEEDSFRPILHHYDGPKFRLELNVPGGNCSLRLKTVNNILKQNESSSKPDLTFYIVH
ncbi:DCD (Development and Cell Death) domain protein [Abeliophyllum distichum]|uniref:DCD (Development and Cell Death) domain protein n=1 Tax=Abeliophyllum distichum TaxID=126358 RepID=A0ABD1UIQ8_9LAMI